MVVSFSNGTKTARGERAGDAYETNFGEFLRRLAGQRIIGTER